MAMMAVVRCSGDLTSLNAGHFRCGYLPKEESLGSFGAENMRLKKSVGARTGSVMVFKFARLAENLFGLQQMASKRYMEIIQCKGPSLRAVKSFGLPNEIDEDLKHSVLEGISQYKLSAITLLLANAMMAVAPFEAHAETCEATDSMFNMPILLGVALVGATVGGLLARQRKGELQKVNEQLRQINTALRRQAKIESYAPSLSYAPVGKVVETEVIVDPKKQELMSHLKSGKSFLRSQNPEKAFFEFKTALELAQNLKDPTEEKKAARGLGASLQRQGKYQDAIKYHSMVLDISKREREHSGSTEAYGAIADCYTELGDLEQAGKYYDRYIERLESD